MDKLGNQPSTKITVARAFQLHQEQIEAIELHVFGDASISGTAAAIYAVIYQSSQVSQGLVTQKPGCRRKISTSQDSNLWRCTWLLIYVKISDQP